MLYKLPLPESAIDAIIDEAKKTPYFHLEGYMERYWLSKPESKKDGGARVHRILRSDTDAHFHDHPWSSTSILLRGSYREVMPAFQSQDPALDDTDFVVVERKAGDVIYRQAKDRHRLELDAPVWSMFIMGPYEHSWGFYPPTGWVHYKDYLDSQVVEDVEKKLTEHFGEAGLKERRKSGE